MISVLISELRSIMHSWRRCRWPSGSWRRTCQQPDAAVICMKLSLETPGKRVRNSKGKLWNTSRESKRYDHASEAKEGLVVQVIHARSQGQRVFFLIVSVFHGLQFVRKLIQICSGKPMYEILFVLDLFFFSWEFEALQLWKSLLFTGAMGVCIFLAILFQAKEQGKTEVEELLSKLEKVTHQS